MRSEEFRRQERFENVVAVLGLIGAVLVYAPVIGRALGVSP